MNADSKCLYAANIQIRLDLKTESFRPENIYSPSVVDYNNSSYVKDCIVSACIWGVAVLELDSYCYKSKKNRNFGFYS